MRCWSIVVPLIHCEYSSQLNAIGNYNDDMNFENIRHCIAAKLTPKLSASSAVATLIGNSFINVMFVCVRVIQSLTSWKTNVYLKMGIYSRNSSLVENITTGSQD